jgi:hypothetical protein
VAGVPAEHRNEADLRWKKVKGAKDLIRDHRQDRLWEEQGRLDDTPEARGMQVLPVKPWQKVPQAVRGAPGLAQGPQGSEAAIAKKMRRAYLAKAKRAAILNNAAALDSWNYAATNANIAWGLRFVAHY